MGNTMSSKQWRTKRSGGGARGLGLPTLAGLLVGWVVVAAQAQAPASSGLVAVGAPRVLPNGVEVTLTRAGRMPLSYPGPSDSVRVHYEGTFEDGRVFDSSYERQQAATFPLNRVIPCWTQGLQHIPVGGAATLHCPATAAYGERGAGGGRIPPNTPLRFKVELLEVLGR